MIVVVVGYKGAAWLPECLRTLADAGRGLRLVLVNNGKENAIESLELSGFDAVVLDTPRPLGFAEANNFALTNVKLDAPAVCFLNQDTKSGPGWLDACGSLLAERPEIGGLSPLLRTYDGQGWDPGFRDCARSTAAFWEAEAAGGGFAPFYELDSVTAAAMVVRTKALLRAGPFDPIFGSYYEDFDLCRRLREAGYMVGVCGGASVNHYSGSSTTTKAAELRRTRQIVRNRAIYRVRQAGARRAAAIAKHFLRDFPKNVARGLARTPSSQPIRAQLGANWDLAKLLGRIGSRRRDEAAWRRYLETITWPQTST